MSLTLNTLLFNCNCFVLAGAHFNPSRSRLQINTGVEIRAKPGSAVGTIWMETRFSEGIQRQSFIHFSFSFLSTD
jgi:hypothetical protein